MPTLILNVTLPKESELLLLELSDSPLRIPMAIKRGMDTALQLIVGKIQRQRLSGTGPYPVSDHRLGTRSGLLQRSARAEPAVITGGGKGADPTVTGAIGSDKFYAEVHEFGMVIRGKPVMRFLAPIAPGATWSGAKHWVIAKTVRIPERAAFRTEIIANEKLISDEVMAELEDAVAKLP
jgi:hypothetical protein